MRHRLFLPVAVAAALVCMATYCADDDYSDTLRFTNRSDIDLYVEYYYLGDGMSGNLYNPTYFITEYRLHSSYINGHSSKSYTNMTQEKFKELTTENDTLFVRVMSQDCKDHLCTYRLTGEDWDACRDLQFPPSPKMRNVNMEPSYEELTANAPSIHDLLKERM